MVQFLVLCIPKGHPQFRWNLVKEEEIDTAPGLAVVDLFYTLKKLSWKQTCKINILPKLTFDKCTLYPPPFRRLFFLVCFQTNQIPSRLFQTRKESNRYDEKYDVSLAFPCFFFSVYIIFVQFLFYQKEHTIHFVIDFVLLLLLSLF